MEMIEELKPCPFCNGQAVLCFHVDSPTRTRYWILCRDCHASPGDKLTEAEAIAAWNTRTAYNPNERLREALEAARAHLETALGPRRTEAEQCVCINVALGIIDAALSHKE